MEDVTMQGQDEDQQPSTTTAGTAIVAAHPNVSTTTTSDQSTTSTTIPEPMDVDSEIATTKSNPNAPTHATENDVSMEAPHLEAGASAASGHQEQPTGHTTAQVSASTGSQEDANNNSSTSVGGSEVPASTITVDPPTTTVKEDGTSPTTALLSAPVVASALTSPPTISVTDTSSSDPTSSTTASTAEEPIKEENGAIAASSFTSNGVESTDTTGISTSPSDASQVTSDANETTVTAVSSDAPAAASQDANGATTIAAAVEPYAQAAPPYMPQFRFTTFSSVAPLPTRNVTSNYLKSDRNYVLRDRAATGDRNVKTLGKRRKHGKDGKGKGGQTSGVATGERTGDVNEADKKGGRDTTTGTPAKDEEDEETAASKRKKTLFELFNEYDRQGGTEGESEDDDEEGDDADDQRRRGGGGRGSKSSKKRQGRGPRREEGDEGSGSNVSDSDSSGENDSSDESDEEVGGAKRTRRSDSDSDLDMDQDTTAVANPDAIDGEEANEGTVTKPVREAGSNVIVIHPGSRHLRIGRASDAYPIDLPHVIARRVYPIPPPTSTTLATSSNAATSNSQTESGAVKKSDEGDEDEAAMEVDEDANEEQEEEETEQKHVTPQEEEDEDIDNFLQNPYLEAIEYDLKARMKAAKRRPVPNAKSQVRSFNSSTRPEEIKDHNDPHKVEWTDPIEEEREVKGASEFFIGQKALNLPPSWLKEPEQGAAGGGRKYWYERFWPIVGGKLNDRDYDSLRVVMADLERIWTKVIHDDLKIEPRKLGKYYALLIIPDMYNKTYVTEMIGMLLNSMRFRGVLVQQEAVCATFGAGVSAACVVDIGAEVTKVSCVEDGICLSDSRAVLKYGGDDITRCFTALVRRNGFPYQDLVFNKRQAYYDWRLMEELKEKWCTMNEADLTVQVYSFFVRKPDHVTLKYQLKVYDEVALSPSCLFFPRVIGRPTRAMRLAEKERFENPKPGFLPGMMNDVDDANDEIPPAVSVAAMFSKKAGATGGEKEKDKTKDSGVATASTTQLQASPAPGEAASGQTSVVGTPVPSSSATMATIANGNGNGNGNGTTAALVPPPQPSFVPAYPFPMDPSVQSTNVPYEVVGTIGKDDFSSFAGLDVVVAQSIANCGSEERSKKLYSSIILVGGGGMTPGFDRVLEDRLFQALPATLTTVEKVEVLPSPRDLDPRLLVWKGASVLSKLDTAKELWIKPQEWLLLGKKILRERALFSWQ